MALDISGLTYFIPIFSFLFVFVVIYALLSKTKLLGENAFIHIITSFTIAIIFATLGNTRQYIETITPWFAVLIIALFFILAIIGFTGKIEDILKPSWLAWVFIIILVIIFIVAATKVYGTTLTPFFKDLKDSFISKEKVYGAILLLAIAGLASWVLTKK